MGRIGEIIEVKAVTVDGDKAVEITVDLGANDVITAIYAEPSGYFSRPLKGDLAIVAELDGAEEYVIVGIVDVSNANALESGEVLFYSRDATGAAACYVNLKNNGETIVGNANGYLQITSTGNITAVNANGGVTINATTGDIKLQNSFNEVDLTAAGCLVNGSVTIAPGQNP